MEARLAHVEALVDQRCGAPRGLKLVLTLLLNLLLTLRPSWARAQEKRRQNAGLERRKQALVDELTALIAGSRSALEAEASAAEAKILKGEAEVERRKRGLQEKREEVGRKRARLLVAETQVERFQSA